MAVLPQLTVAGESLGPVHGSRYTKRVSIAAVLPLVSRRGYTNAAVADQTARRRRCRRRATVRLDSRDDLLGASNALRLALAAAPSTSVLYGHGGWSGDES